MRWDGWGSGGQAAALPVEIRRLLADALDVRTPTVTRASEAAAAAALPEPTVPAPVLDDLVDAVGTAHVQLDATSRLRHAAGRSTPDLLRLRAGDPPGAPDAVVRPLTHVQVLDVLRLATRHRVAVVPYGGGTSVVGGLRGSRAGHSAVMALDLSRMDRLLDVDEESGIATFEPGLRGPQAEELLAPFGLTIGHFPQSFEYATLGGFAATRSSGQASAGYGRFDDLVVAVRLATPTGTLQCGRAPASAAGPDLRQLVLGSEGVFGVITELALQVRPIPEVRHYEGWSLPTFVDGLTTVGNLAMSGAHPTVVRFSDEAETAVGLARPDEIGAAGNDGCQLVLGFEGATDEVAVSRHAAATLLAAAGARSLGEEPGAAWERGRFRGPYLRDALLDAGVLVETLETAAFWSRLPTLYSAVRQALSSALTADGARPLVLCHVSHVYPTGASLYFTVACAQGQHPLDRWAAAKRAAGDAIAAAGGTISHHHGVGTDHLPWYRDEVGPVGLEVLRAVKDRLDPAGILNPGVLLGP